MKTRQASRAPVGTDDQIKPPAQSQWRRVSSFRDLVMQRSPDPEPEPTPMDVAQPAPVVGQKRKLEDDDASTDKTNDRHKLMGLTFFTSAFLGLVPINSLTTAFGNLIGGIYRRATPEKIQAQQPENIPEDDEEEEQEPTEEQNIDDIIDDAVEIQSQQPPAQLEKAVVDPAAVVATTEKPPPPQHVVAGMPTQTPARAPPLPGSLTQPTPSAILTAISPDNDAAAGRTTPFGATALNNNNSARLAQGDKQMLEPVIEQQLVHHHQTSNDQADGNQQHDDQQQLMADNDDGGFNDDQQHDDSSLQLVQNDPEQVIDGLPRVRPSSGDARRLSRLHLKQQLRRQAVAPKEDSHDGMQTGPGGSRLNTSSRGSRLAVLAKKPAPTPYTYIPPREAPPPCDILAGAGGDYYADEGEADAQPRATGVPHLLQRRLTQSPPPSQQTNSHDSRPRQAVAEQQEVSKVVEVATAVEGDVHGAAAAAMEEEEETSPPSPEVAMADNHHQEERNDVPATDDKHEAVAVPRVEEQSSLPATSLKIRTTPAQQPPQTVAPAAVVEVQQEQQQRAQSISPIPENIFSPHRPIQRGPLSSPPVALTCADAMQRVSALLDDLEQEDDGDDERLTVSVPRSFRRIGGMAGSGLLVEVNGAAAAAMDVDVLGRDFATEMLAADQCQQQNAAGAAAGVAPPPSADDSLDWDDFDVEVLLDDDDDAFFEFGDPYKKLSTRLESQAAARSGKTRTGEGVDKAQVLDVGVALPVADSNAADAGAGTIITEPGQTPGSSGRKRKVRFLEPTDSGKKHEEAEADNNNNASGTAAAGATTTSNTATTTTTTTNDGRYRGAAPRQTTPNKSGGHARHHLPSIPRFGPGAFVRGASPGANGNNSSYNDWGSLSPIDGPSDEGGTVVIVRRLRHKGRLAGRMSLAMPPSPQCDDGVVQELREAFLNNCLVESWQRGEAWARLDIAGVELDTRQGDKDRVKQLACALAMRHGFGTVSSVLRRLQLEWRHLRTVRRKYANSSSNNAAPVAETPRAPSPLEHNETLPSSASVPRGILKHPTLIIPEDFALPPASEPSPMELDLGTIMAEVKLKVQEKKQHLNGDGVDIGGGGLNNIHGQFGGDACQVALPLDFNAQGRMNSRGARMLGALTTVPSNAGGAPQDGAPTNNNNNKATSTVAAGVHELTIADGSGATLPSGTAATEVLPNNGAVVTTTTAAEEQPQHQVDTAVQQQDQQVPLLDQQQAKQGAATVGGGNMATRSSRGQRLLQALQGPTAAAAASLVVDS